MTEILDHYGHPITLGARVLDDDGNEEGTVIEVTEPHAEYSDLAGCDVATGPYVAVRYDDGSLLTWGASRGALSGPDDYTCDDIAVRPSLTNYELAHRLVDAEQNGDADTQAECLNEIAGRLNLPLDMTEQGLTAEANRRIELWIDANWTTDGHEPDGQRMEAGRIVPTDR